MIKLFAVGNKLYFTINKIEKPPFQFNLMKGFIFDWCFLPNFFSLFFEKNKKNHFNQLEHPALD